MTKIKLIGIILCVILGIGIVIGLFYEFSNQVAEPVFENKRVISMLDNKYENIARVLIIEDGNVTILENEEAQEFIKYKTIESQELESQKTHYDKNNNFHNKTNKNPDELMWKKYYYKYNQIGTNDFYHRVDLARRMSNILRNESSVEQSDPFNYPANESWRINSGVTDEYLKVVESTLGSSWTVNDIIAFNKYNDRTINIPSKTQVSVVFYPIMKNSWGYSEKWVKNDDSDSGDTFIESKWVDTYSPIYEQDNEMNIKSVDGVFIWIHEPI